MKSAILVVEARGQSIHCREDATVNLMQAVWLAGELLRRGVETRVRLIMDAGQSVEEYSLLCHRKFDLKAMQASMTGPDARARRYAFVRELREWELPIVLDAVDGDGVAVEDRLFYSPLLARIGGVNEKVVAAMRTSSHPMIAAGRVDDYELLVAEYAGLPYLDLDVAVAKVAFRTILGSSADEIDIAAVSRPHDATRQWLQDRIAHALVENDLEEKERGAGADFNDRLIGLFLSITPDGEERPYFNSPTCVRVEHGKVRVIARDRFNILGLAASERMRFDRFRSLIEAQAAGAPERLLAIKYPHTAGLVAGGIAEEARDLLDQGPVKVMFIDGIGGWNPSTSGLLDARLCAEIPPQVEYHRVVGTEAMYEMLPNEPGGLLLVMDALRPMMRALFPAEIEVDSLLEFAAPIPAGVAGT